MLKHPKLLFYNSDSTYNHHLQGHGVNLEPLFGECDLSMIKISSILLLFFCGKKVKLKSYHKLVDLLPLLNILV